MDVSFVDYNRQFLSLSHKWLSDKEIKHLTNTPDVTRESQEIWFSSLHGRNDYYIKGVLFNGRPIGACGLKHITSTDGEYWGYIGEKDYWGKGIGGRMMAFIEECAKSLGLRQIYLHVLKDNERAIRLYTKNGYRAVSEKDNLTKMTKQL